MLEVKNSNEWFDVECEIGDVFLLLNWLNDNSPIYMLQDTESYRLFLFFLT